MSTVAVTRTVPIPARTVWAIFSDLDLRPTWLSEVEHVELLTAGPLRLGTRWLETRKAGDGRMVCEELVVTALDPNRGCTVAVAGEAERHQLTYRFSSVEVGSGKGGTTISVTVRWQPHGFTDRLLSFLLGGFAARTVEGALRHHVDALALSCLDRVSAWPAAA